MCGDREGGWERGGSHVRGWRWKVEGEAGLVHGGELELRECRTCAKCVEWRWKGEGEMCVEEGGRARERCVWRKSCVWCVFD